MYLGLLFPTFVLTGVNGNLLKHEGQGSWDPRRLNHQYKEFLPCKNGSLHPSQGTLRFDTDGGPVNLDEHRSPVFRSSPQC